MATPYVAGIMAIALGGYGQVAPAALSEELKKRASDEVTFSREDELAGRSSTHKLARVW